MSVATAGLPVYQSANGSLYSGVSVLVIDPTDSGTMYAVIAGGGFLFYKLVRVLSRIQMPRPPSH